MLAADDGVEVLVVGGATGGVGFGLVRGEVPEGAFFVVGRGLRLGLGFGRHVFFFVVGRRLRLGLGFRRHVFFVVGRRLRLGLGFRRHVFFFVVDRRLRLGLGFRRHVFCFVVGRRRLRLGLCFCHDVFFFVVGRRLRLGLGFRRHGFFLFFFRGSRLRFTRGFFALGGGEGPVGVVSGLYVPRPGPSALSQGPGRRGDGCLACGKCVGRTWDWSGSLADEWCMIHKSTLRCA